MLNMTRKIWHTWSPFMAVELYGTIISTLPFYSLLLSPHVVLLLAQRQHLTAPPSPPAFWPSTAISRQKSVAAAHCRPGPALPCVWAVPEAGCQVSGLQRGEVSPRYPVSDRHPALEHCRPPWQCAIRMQEAASAVKQTFPSNRVLNLSSTAVRQEYAFKRSHLKVQTSWGNSRRHLTASQPGDHQ